MQKMHSDQQHKYDKIWLKFNEAEIQNYVDQGKVVVVDVTADWCITCKFNKIRVLRSKKIMQLLKSEDVVAMRGDITSPNKEILDYLHRNNRFAIPFNAVYGPNNRSGTVTSELLDEEEFYNLIENAK